MQDTLSRWQGEARPQSLSARAPCSGPGTCDNYWRPNLDQSRPVPVEDCSSDPDTECGRSMRTAILSMIVVVAMAETQLLGQEVISRPKPMPDPGAGTPHNEGVGAPTRSILPSDTANASSRPEGWRYRWHNGRWWYWTTADRWMWYSDDGQWIAYETNRPPSEPRRVDESNPASNGNGGYYHPGQDDPSYPSYGPSYPAYWLGRYPGVSVGVGQYGTVGVGVGQSVGVQVWGGHGGVRVGPINVGW